SSRSRGARRGRMPYSSAGIRCAMTPCPLRTCLCSRLNRCSQPATPPSGVVSPRTRASTAPEASSMCSHAPPSFFEYEPGGNSSQNAARCSVEGRVLANTLAAPLNRAAGTSAPRDAASGPARARACSSAPTPAALALLARRPWALAAGGTASGGAGGHQLDEGRVGALRREGLGDPLLEGAHLLG